MSLGILLRPDWLAIKRRWTGELEFKGQSGRDFILFVFGIIISYALYFGVYWALGKVNENPALSKLPAGDFLGMVFLVLFIMVLISTVLSAIGTLFLSEDLELVLSSPVPSRSFFFGKFFYVYFSASWMPFLFIAPVIIAFGHIYHPSWLYYLMPFLLMLGWFAIPAGLGMLIAVLLVLVVPVYRVREMFIVLMIAAAAGIYMLCESIGLQWTTLKSAEEMLRIIAILTMPSITWLPSNWLAGAIQDLLQPGGISWQLYATLLYSCAAVSISLAYIAVRLFENRAYSLVRNKRRDDKVSSRQVQKALRFLGRPLSPPFRGILGKELRVLSRDVAQAVQVLMLLVLGLIYLYHMRVFSAVESFPESIRPWWKSFMFLGNVCMGAFISTAICTRFVYPAISMEGRSFWVLQTSPLSIRDIMKVKFWSWYVPVAIISCLFFVSGASIIGGDFAIILVNALSSIIICYGIVGLAIGIGAIFAHFDWEHSSQLAAGFGSFIFMLSSIILVFVDMIPASFMLFDNGGGSYHRSSRFYAFVGLNLLIVAVVNYLLARVVMQRGERNLEKS